MDGIQKSEELHVAKWRTNFKENVSAVTSGD